MPRKRPPLRKLAAKFRRLMERVRYHRFENGAELLHTRIPRWKQKQGIASGLARRCDCVIINETTIKLNEPIPRVRTIFVNTRVRRGSPILHDLLAAIPRGVVIVVAGSDNTFPHNVDLRTDSTSEERIKQYQEVINNPKVNRLFVENLDARISDKLVPIPLGINPKHSPTDLNYFLQFENTSPDRPIKMTDFNVLRNATGQFATRKKVRDLCSGQWRDLVVKTPVVGHPRYLKIMSKYAFTLCVHGGEIDPCPKAFEAIAVGTIPIIERSVVAEAFSGLPVVVVDAWDADAITEAKLRQWHEELTPRITGQRRSNLEKLTMDYWWRRIEAATGRAAG